MGMTPRNAQKTSASARHTAGEDNHRIPGNVQQNYIFSLVWCGGCGGPSTAAPHDLPPIDACVNATASTAV